MKEFLVFSILHSRHELEGTPSFTLNDTFGNHRMWLDCRFVQEDEELMWQSLPVSLHSILFSHYPSFRLFILLLSAFATLFQCVCEVIFCDRRLHSCQIGCISVRNWSSFHCTLSWNMIHTQRNFKKNTSQSFWVRWGCHFGLHMVCMEDFEDVYQKSIM